MPKPQAAKSRNNAPQLGVARALTAGIALVFSGIVAASGASSSAPLHSLAQSPASAAAPTLDQVLDRYVQALGGKAAIEKLSTRVMKGTVENPATGEVGTVEVYKKAPNKELSTINIPSNDGASTRGYDGATGWTFDPDSGPGDMGPGDLAAMKLESDFYREVRLRELFPKMKLAGAAKIEGRETYVVDAPEEAGTEKLYFDQQTGLLVRDEVPTETEGGKTVIQSTFEDYRDVDGVKLPFTVRQTSPDFDFVIKYTEISHHVAVDDSKFAKPRS